MKLIANATGYKIIRSNDDAWLGIEESLKEHQSSSSSSSNATKSNYSLSEEEKKRVLARYDAIEEKNKWHLKTSAVVEDKMKALVECSSFEHPVHSMIMDPDDIVWMRYFTPDELNEIKSYGVKPLEKLPQELQKYLDSYDKEWKTGNKLCEYAENQKYIPLIEFDKRWIRQSIIGISELFCDNNHQLHFEDYSESDLLHELWPFVYKCFRDRRIQGKLGERSSIAVGLARNANRSLETIKKKGKEKQWEQKLFKVGNKEFGSCEIGRDKVTVVDDKYMDDGLSSCLRR